MRVGNCDDRKNRAILDHVMTGGTGASTQGTTTTPDSDSRRGNAAFEVYTQWSGIDIGAIKYKAW